MNSFMDKEYYMNNAGVPPPQHLKPDTTMSIPWNGMNLINTELRSNSSSSAYIDQYYAHLESTLSSITSSPAPTTLPLSNDVFALRELIGKQLGGGMSNATHSSYNSAPLSSPSPKLRLPSMGSLGNSPLPPVPPIACDPGFAERAAKFSCFGSRSFNGRTMVNNAELSQRSNHLATGNAKLQRVSSSPALKQAGSPLEIKNMSQLQMESVANNGIVMTSDKKSSSNEESSVSELVLNGETESKSDMNLKKRKANSRVKSYKSSEGEDEGALKRSKPTESGDKTEIKAANNDENDQKQKANQKPPEPPKDYIHVRARRGQATDSHSLAERVRREKISERMKLLQDLVPGCNKVTGKALMLDEIINYVQSLQRQVEFLSMKLATVNPGVDFNMNNILPKDVFQENGTLQQHLYPIDDTSSSAFYQHHHQNVQHQQQPLHNNNANVSVDPLGIQFPSLTGFSEFPALGEDDLQSIVRMGFAVDFPAAPDDSTDVKIEL